MYAVMDFVCVCVRECSWDWILFQPPLQSHINRTVTLYWRKEEGAGGRVKGSSSIQVLDLL